MTDLPSLLAVGDLVAFTDDFLERHGRFFTNMAAAQGEVTGVLQLDNGVRLAEVAWDTPAMPKRINAKYLIRKTILTSLA